MPVLSPVRSLRSVPNNIHHISELSEISATQYKLSVVYVITPSVGCLLNSLPVASQLPITAG